MTGYPLSAYVLNPNPTSDAAAAKILQAEWQNFRYMTQEELGESILARHVNVLAGYGFFIRDQKR